MLNVFKGWFKSYSKEEKELSQAVERIIGEKPGNIELYSLAMMHSSVAEENHHGFKESNERLEYLGDAVLGAVVAEYLFKKYPYKNEGFLTEIRARIVNREALNALAVKIGLSELVVYEGKRKSPQAFKSIYGDAMEAFFGAIYLDKGFKFCRKYIVKRILPRHYNIDEIIETTTNFKSLMIEWSQKNNRTIDFEVAEDDSRQGKSRFFKARLLLDGEVLSEGNGFSKKKAEQDAARKACEQLEIDH